MGHSREGRLHDELYRTTFGQEAASDYFDLKN